MHFMIGASLSHQSKKYLQRQKQCVVFYNKLNENSKKIFTIKGLNLSNKICSDLSLKLFYSTQSFILNFLNLKTPQNNPCYQEDIANFFKYFLKSKVIQFFNFLSIIKYLFWTWKYMNQGKLVLYSYFQGSSPWRVRIALNHKNIPHQFKFIHLIKGEQKSEEYKKIHPNASVPSLVLSDGRVLIQSVAIIQYLEQAYPNTPIYPKDPVLKAQIRGFCEVINSGLQPYQNLKLLEKISNDFKGDKIEWSRYWVVRGMQTIEEMVKKSRGKYCFGDQITAADFFFVPHVQGGSTRFNVSLDQYPNIKEILANLQQLEAFKKAQPQNQADFEK